MRRVKDELSAAIASTKALEQKLETIQTTKVLTILSLCSAHLTFLAPN
jgi:Fe2+ transport system protein B